MSKHCRHLFGVMKLFNDNICQTALTGFSWLQETHTKQDNINRCRQTQQVDDVWLKYSYTNKINNYKFILWHFSTFKRM